jgi:SAM-dependent methyltransferase
MMQAPYQPATNYWRAVEIEEVIKYDLPYGQGLDLGCGDGHLMAILLGHAGQRDLVGVDIDSNETSLARGRNIYREVVTAAADHLPFSDGQFDFIFSNSVLEHIHNIDGVLNEVARVLRHGGRFLFTIPSADFHRCLRGPRSAENRERYFQEIDARCHHLRYWDASQWSEHLRRSGLIPVHEHAYLSSFQVRRWEWLARYTSGVLYRLLRQKKQPIEIQRQFQLRRLRIRMPRFLASLSAKVMDLHVHSGEPPYCGCLLVEARKSA